MLHVSRKAWAGMVRIVAAERRVLVFPVNANRRGGRMARYVPKGIVGHKQGIIFLIKNNCFASGDVFILR
jgi:hypothetical protein